MVDQLPAELENAIGITRTIRHLISSITKAFQRYFLPTPANQAFRRAINELSLTLESTGTHDEQLSRVCSTFRKLQRRKDLDQPLQELIPQLLALTEGLRQANAGSIDRVLLERVEQEVLEGPEDNGRSELRSASDILSREEMEQLFPGKNYEPCTVTDLAELMDIPALKKLNDISPDRLKSCRTLMTDLATGLRFLPHKFHHDINDIPLMFDSAAKHASQQDLEQAGAIMACVASSERQAVAGVAMTVLDTINSAWAEHDTGKVIDSHKKFCSAVARKIQDQLPDFHTSINVFTNLFPEEFWPDIFDATPHLLNDLLTSAIINQDMSFLRKLQANNISITEAERVKGESFFQWTYPHEAHDTAALLLDLGADIDAKRPDGTPYFKDSDTFPYDHQIILRADDPRLPIDWSMPLVKKNPRSSTLYTWDMAANSMKKEAGKPRSFTGNYKLVIEAHGNDLLVSDGRQHFSGEQIARKIKELIEQNGAFLPKKLQWFPV